MVTRWGLSDRLGPQTYSEESGEVFLGRSVTQHKQVSDVTAHVIDEEVRRVIDSNYQRAYKILQSNMDKLQAMSEALIKYETIDEEQIKDIMEGRVPRPPPRIKQRSSSYSPLRQIISPGLKARSRIPGSFSYALRNASRWSSLKFSKISNRLSRCHSSHGGIFSLTGWFDTTPSQRCVISDVNRAAGAIPRTPPSSQSRIY